MDHEHLSSQAYLWFFVLRSISRLSFLPPLEVEPSFLPLVPNTVWRHRYSILNGFVADKQYAAEEFFGKSEGVDLVHHGMIQAVRLKELCEQRVRTAWENQL